MTILALSESPIDAASLMSPENGRRAPRRPILGIALAVACLSAALPAIAQIPGSQQPTPRQEQDNRTPAARAAEIYDPKGVPVGSFLLFPSMELDETFNDNIFATSAATGRTSSFVQIVRPSIDLRSTWNNHMLNFFARGGFGFYSADSAQNFQDFSIGADGRFDIQRQSNVYGGASFTRGHEELGTPNTVSGTFQPTVYNQIATNVGYYQQLGHFKVRLDGRLDNYSYLNNGVGPAQGVIPNTDRNRTEFREAVRVGYEVIQGFEIWTRGSLNQRRYDTQPDSSGFDRDSSGWDGVAGLAIDFGGITFLEAFAGYIQQNYVDAQFQTVRAPTFGLTGYWNPIRELWVKPYVRRTIDDTSLSTSSGYLNTSGGVDIDYNWRPNVRLTGHGDYSIADYQQVSSSNNRYDQYLTLRAGVLYYLTPNFYLGPSYQYIHRTSNQFNSDYDQNLVMLRLGARL